MITVACWVIVEDMNLRQERRLPTSTRLPDPEEVEHGSWMVWEQPYISHYDKGDVKVVRLRLPLSAFS